MFNRPFKYLLFSRNNISSTLQSLKKYGILRIILTGFFLPQEKIIEFTVLAISENLNVLSEKKKILHHKLHSNMEALGTILQRELLPIF